MITWNPISKNRWHDRCINRLYKLEQRISCDGMKSDLKNRWHDRCINLAIIQVSIYSRCKALAACLLVKNASSVYCFVSWTIWSLTARPLGSSLHASWTKNCLHSSFLEAIISTMPTLMSDWWLQWTTTCWRVSLLRHVGWINEFVIILYRPVWHRVAP
jgi:hypothetical protein